MIDFFSVAVSAAHLVHKRHQAFIINNDFLLFFADPFNQYCGHTHNLFTPHTPTLLAAIALQLIIPLID